MANPPSGFSFQSNLTNEPRTMDFPASLTSNIHSSARQTQPLLQHGMQYAHVRPGTTGETYGTNQGNMSIQRTNTFEVPRFQLQYNQPLSVPTFCSFPGAAYNQIVAQRAQLTPSNATNLQAVPLSGLSDAPLFIPQAGVVQQPPGSLSGLDEKADTLPSFSSIVASAASSISTMNMQLMDNSSKVAETLSASQMFAGQTSQTKMAGTTPQIMINNSQAQQAFYAGAQLGAKIQPTIQQIPQQMQSKASGFFLRNQFPSAQQDVSSDIPLTASTQRSSDSPGNPDSCVQSGHLTGGTSISQTLHEGPVQVLQSPGISNTSFSATGLIPSNTLPREEVYAKDDSDSNSFSPHNSNREKMPVSNTESSTEFSSANLLEPDRADMASSEDSSNPDTQQMIQISRPTLKHTIKKYPPRESRGKIKQFKPKSMLDVSASLLTPFFYLGKYGDKSPWKHHVDCDLYEFFDCMDLNDDDSQELDPSAVLQDSNHNIKNQEDTVESDRSMHEQSLSPVLAAYPNLYEHMTGEKENIKIGQSSLDGGNARNSRSVISISLNRNSESPTGLGEDSTSQTRRTRKPRAASEKALTTPNRDQSDYVSQSAAASEAPAVGSADDSSQEDGVHPSTLKRDPESEEDEDYGVVFPGMDLSPSGVGKTRSFFQVQPELDDIPYYDNVDSDAEMKRKVWQATKERLEMERLDVHVKIEDSQCILVGDSKRWQCNLCPKNYTTKHNLVTHILDHNGIKPHLCMVCGKYFKQLSHLNTHMLTHDNIKPHVCPLCGKGFTQVSHLKRHQAVHLDNKPNICDICNRGFAYPSELRVHKEKHIPGRDKCVDCGEDFASPRLLKQHQATHEQREELTCNQCNRGFRYPSQLRDHIVSHTGTRPFICTECGMDFMKEHHLKAHMFTHTGLRPYSCQECGRSFNQKANLLRHMLIHSSERAYKCDQCDKTFTQPQTLKAHMVVHADKKPYWCNICGKEFGRLHNLQGHMHMHNNSKPYVCFCGSSFTLKGNLNRHKKVKHGLNESTESMEEEAVNFLSIMSERARDDKSQDDEELESPELPTHPEGSDLLDSPSIDQTGDPRSHRRERKSTPRKIPRQRKSTEESFLKDDEEETSKYFNEQDQNYAPSVSVKRNRECSSDEEDSESRISSAKRSRRSSQMVKVKVKEEIGDESQSDNDEEVKDDEEDDEEWNPSGKRPRLKRGVKLDSIIAKKFQNV